MCAFVSGLTEWTLARVVVLVVMLSAGLDSPGLDSTGLDFDSTRLDSALGSFRVRYECGLTAEAPIPSDPILFGSRPPARPPARPGPADELPGATSLRCGHSGAALESNDDDDDGNDGSHWFLAAHITHSHHHRQEATKTKEVTHLDSSSRVDRGYSRSVQPSQINSLHLPLKSPPFDHKEGSVLFSRGKKRKEGEKGKRERQVSHRLLALCSY